MLETTIIYTPDELDEKYGKPWAHCVIKEVNIIDYNKKDKESKMRIKTFAKLMSEQSLDIEVRGPYLRHSPLTAIARSEAHSRC